VSPVEFVCPAIVAWAAMAAAMALLWGVQRRTGNAGIVDVAWTAGVGIIAVAMAAVADGPPARRLLLATLAGAWSLRLAVHLGRRVIGHPEDPRYGALRRDWGARAQRNLFGFYQAQAFAAALFALPFAAVLSKDSGPGVWDAVGAAIGVVAIAGEAVADWQLARFKMDPANRGRICDTGLWAWSRHPNYFFEWLYWWAFVALAAGAPYAAWSLVGPAAMLYFLVRVTGIPTTERRMLETRGESFREYRRRVSAFVPWPPRTG